MNNGKLSVKWLYTFIAITIIALATGIAGLYLKEYFIASCMALIFVVQIINIVKWKKQ